MKNLILIGSLVIAVSIAGCIALGSKFSDVNLTRVELNKTTKPDIWNMFGAPVAKGTEDGKETWSYFYVKCPIFMPSKTAGSYLQFRFDKYGKVEKYSFNQSD